MLYCIRAFVARFFVPSVDKVMGEFTTAISKLEALVVHHDTKAERLQDKMDTMRALQASHDREAIRASAIASNLNALLK